ncbi:hypothetical protein KZZ52_52215 [Dactylosporangium sp. AC04546]|uniref:RICIN domain-containing protein n=1 Tax=Dactylosporangium sp. AC04546 TaxID=2862460 RepID=UPI001EE0A1DC|nr:ricin-type beta-trefoil lectin domain protein [Dactylosporangium sp. AC04546]WVK82428.1 hypothetical protein KZZ52_52215 [Dactylosporangium sp. AC04546]
MILRRLRGDDGSLPLAMMLTLVGTSLSTLMVPVVIQQLRDTQRTVERAQALHAAQAGIDVVIGAIRATGGNPDHLCPVTTPFTGAVGGGKGRYTVSVTFQDAARKPVGCPLKTVVPSYALITSTGTNVPGTAFPADRSRTLTATYVFRFTNENIEGGLVKFYGGTYCLDAGSSSPAVGTNVTTQPCSTGSPRQIFAYTRNLTLVLVSSRTAANPQGMCLDSAADPVSGTLIQFRPCGSPTVPYHQQWNINDSSNFQSTDNTGTKLGAYCFHAKAGSTKGAFVELLACGGASDNTRTFAPEASVGAGAAGPPAQLVNFKQFGRCVDVTNFDVTKGFLIVWPCKQAPNQANVGWNQRFTIPATSGGTGHATGQIVTYDSSKLKTNVCLTTAKRTEFVTMQPCPAKGTASAEWTVSYQEKTYGASYVIRDSAGLCLTPTDLDAKPLLESNIFRGSTVVSKLTVDHCDGSKLQKWNAPANTEDPSPLKDIGED